MQPDPARAVRCFDVRWENGRKPVHKQGIVRQRHFCPIDPVFYWVYALAVSWTFCGRGALYARGMVALSPGKWPSHTQAAGWLAQEDLVIVDPSSDIVFFVCIPCTTCSHCALPTSPCSLARPCTPHPHETPKPTLPAVVGGCTWYAASKTTTPMMGRTRCTNPVRACANATELVAVRAGSTLCARDSCVCVRAMGHWLQRSV